MDTAYSAIKFADGDVLSASELNYDALAYVQLGDDVETLLADKPTQCDATVVFSNND